MTRDSALEMSLIEEVARLSSSGSSSKPSWKWSASTATSAKGAALPERILRGSQVRSRR